MLQLTELERKIKQLVNKTNIMRSVQHSMTNLNTTAEGGRMSAG